MNFQDNFFRQSADDLIDQVLVVPNELRQGITAQDWQSGKALTATIPRDIKMKFLTVSGKIEFYNKKLVEKLPRYQPPSGGLEPLHLVVAPSVQTLNSTFIEQPELNASRGRMSLLMNPDDAEQRSLLAGQIVVAQNQLGKVEFELKVTADVLAGTVIAEGVWAMSSTYNGRSVNALLSPRLTDMGSGSTLSDNCVEVRGRDVD